jgi:hypothetical protein
MKKMTALPALLLVAALAAEAVFAQELTITGEIKTGLYWENVTEGDKPAKDHAQVGNTDDAGYPGAGRFRLNIGFVSGVLGVKVRFEQTAWTDTSAPRWGYAYVFGDFFDEQLKLSAGRLGDSVWGTGGPEINSNLDEVVGMRTEIHPHFLPGLNFGFVLNNPQNAGYQERSMVDLLMESVIGAVYVHDLFEVRLNYRLDGKADYSNNKEEGMNFTYRVEEKALRKLAPGLAIWANGKFDGINAEEVGVTSFTNWLYIQYAPKPLDVQLRTCYQVGYERNVLTLKPMVYYDITELLTVGSMFAYAMDWGDASIGGAYNVLLVEPMVRINFAGAYIAAVYGYQNAYTAKDTVTKTHYINLRWVYSF